MKKTMDLWSALSNTVTEKYPDCDTKWAKRIRAVQERTIFGLYSLDGEFVPAGEIEVDIEPQAFIVQTIDKHKRLHYIIVMMDAEGNLVCQDMCY